VTGDQARPGFNHNYAYHRYLLRQVPPGCGRALDAGCGAGLFARRLARHARSVDAIDRAPEVIAAARALSADTPGIRYIEADLTGYDLGNGRYDYIACIATIHHMPFDQAISKLRDALAPGGVLAIIGCYRQATPADYARDLAAIPANMTANTITKAKTRWHGSSPARQVSTAPVMDPQMTLPEIKREALRLLPGASSGSTPSSTTTRPARRDDRRCSTHSDSSDI
jgi:SAM-dependent methyltransferase